MPVLIILVAFLGATIGVPSVVSHAHVSTASQQVEPGQMSGTVLADTNTSEARASAIVSSSAQGAR
jgi:hypothetical protein